VHQPTKRFVFERPGGLSLTWKIGQLNSRQKKKKKKEEVIIAWAVLCGRLKELDKREHPEKTWWDRWTQFGVIHLGPA